MIVIGLTGPSGAGKSVVADLFARYGLPVLDADGIYRQLLVPPSDCLRELAKEFGEEILAADGTLQRKKLASIVFGDADALKRLDEISHRYVMEEARRQIRSYRERGILAVVFDAPQLFEAGADKECNLIVSVLADRRVRLERIMERDRLSSEEAEARITAQYSDDFFRNHSDYVIENNENPESLAIPVQKILTEAGILPL